MKKETVKMRKTRKNKIGIILGLEVAFIIGLLAFSGGMIYHAKGVVIPHESTTLMAALPGWQPTVDPKAYERFADKAGLIHDAVKACRENPTNPKLPTGVSLVPGITQPANVKVDDKTQAAAFMVKIPGLAEGEAIALLPTAVFTPLSKEPILRGSAVLMTKSASAGEVAGVLFDPRYAISQRDGVAFEPIVVTPRASQEVRELLQLAKENELVLEISAHLRGVDGPGSSLDLPEFQIKLTKPDAKGVYDIASTPTLTSDFKVTIRFEMAEDPDVIEYVAPDYGITEANPYIVRGKVQLVKDKFGRDRCPYGQRDAPAYIFSNLFGITGVKITCERISPMALAGGMESSNAFNVALFAAASTLSGQNWSMADIFSKAVEIENNELGGLTGGQGHLASMLGGAYHHMWLSGIRDADGKLINPYGAFSMPFIVPEDYHYVEGIMSLAQAGKEYKDGRAPVGRTAALINNMWTDLIREKDERGVVYGIDLHGRKPALAAAYIDGMRAYVNAMKIGDTEGARRALATVVGAVNTYADIRDELCRRWADLVLNRGKTVWLERLETGDKEALATSGLDDAAREQVLARVITGRDEAGNKIYNEAELNKAALENLEVIHTRGISLYSDTSKELIQAARQRGMAVMPLGAGGPWANFVVVGEDQEGLFKSQNMPQLTDETAGAIVKGTGVLRGYMPLRIGGEPIQFKGFDRLAELSGRQVRLPALPVKADFHEAAAVGQLVRFGTPKAAAAGEVKVGDIRIPILAPEVDKYISESTVAKLVEAIRLRQLEKVNAAEIGMTTDAGPYSFDAYIAFTEDGVPVLLRSGRDDFIGIYTIDTARLTAYDVEKILQKIPADNPATRAPWIALGNKLLATSMYAPAPPPGERMPQIFALVKEHLGRAGEALIVPLPRQLGEYEAAFGELKFSAAQVYEREGQTISAATTVVPEAVTPEMVASQLSPEAREVAKAAQQPVYYELAGLKGVLREGLEERILGQMRFGMIIMPPAIIGGEFAKTRGVYATHPTVYQAVSAPAMVVLVRHAIPAEELEKAKEKAALEALLEKYRVEEVLLTAVEAGQQVVVPAGVGVTIINPSRQAPLIVTSLSHAEAITTSKLFEGERDYERGGAPYHVKTNIEGKIMPEYNAPWTSHAGIEPNIYYGVVEEVPEIGLSKGVPLAKMVRPTITEVELRKLASYLKRGSFPPLTIGAIKARKEAGRTISAYGIKGLGIGKAPIKQLEEEELERFTAVFGLKKDALMPVTKAAAAGEVIYQLGPGLGLKPVELVGELREAVVSGKVETKEGATILTEEWPLLEMQPKAENLAGVVLAKPVAEPKAEVKRIIETAAAKIPAQPLVEVKTPAQVMMVEGEAGIVRLPLAGPEGAQALVELAKGREYMEFLAQAIEELKTAVGTDLYGRAVDIHALFTVATRRDGTRYLIPRVNPITLALLANNLKDNFKITIFSIESLDKDLTSDEMRRLLGQYGSIFADLVQANTITDVVTRIEQRGVPRDHIAVTLAQSTLRSALERGVDIYGILKGAIKCFMLADPTAVGYLSIKAMFLAQMGNLEGLIPASTYQSLMRDIENADEEALRNTLVIEPESEEREKEATSQMQAASAV